MLILAIVLFLAVALGGLFLLTAILQNRPVNQVVKTLHGVFAALGLIIIIVYMLAFMTGEAFILKVSLIILIIAALGGLTLVSLAKKGKPAPKVVVLIHPIIAIAGLIALIIYVLP
ncbi:MULTISPECIES: hypothetical protein [Legionella]|uniref:Transmembrane protein n=1 Tax=Legionella steelei TaxID=947033 RepID=A0A0W0ZD97_9GAMM|nr:MULTISPECIES: hypothetical protein [Legionella]KTD67055.1 hypothetical protein Lste_3261 [Legionella steelei]MBN9229157.1 hypothetical protein [Legionella steelei]OJW14081.1 MAG: hypothetical protein BGO44_09015 [Legionella sp. 39-23]